eukprot:gene20214-26961_t
MASATCDPCAELDAQSLHVVLSMLDASDLSRCISVSAAWREQCQNKSLWAALCKALWSTKAYVPESLQCLAGTDPKSAYHLSCVDGERMEVTEAELTSFTWSCSFRESAGFLTAPASDPLWSNGIREHYTWQFRTINSYGSEGLFVQENIWVILLSDHKQGPNPGKIEGMIPNSDMEPYFDGAESDDDLMSSGDDDMGSDHGIDSEDDVDRSQPFSKAKVSKAIELESCSHRSDWSFGFEISAPSTVPLRIIFFFSFYDFHFASSLLETAVHDMPQPSMRSAELFCYLLAFNTAIMIAIQQQKQLQQRLIMMVLLAQQVEALGPSAVGSDAIRADREGALQGRGAVTCARQQESARNPLDQAEYNGGLGALRDLVIPRQTINRTLVQPPIYDLYSSPLIGTISKLKCWKLGFSSTSSFVLVPSLIRLTWADFSPHIPCVRERNAALPGPAVHPLTGSNPVEPGFPNGRDPVERAATVNSVVATTVAPVHANLIGTAMFFSPVKAVLEDLNPLPFVAIIVNCIGWSVYGVLAKDAYVMPANIIGILVGLYFTLSVFSACSQKIQDLMHAIVFAASVYFSLLGYLTMFLFTNDQAVLVWGTSSMVFTMIFYLAPLSSMLKVVQQGNAASIYLPLSIAIVCYGSAWTIYGLAIGVWNIWVPNSFGAILGVLQTALHLMYGARGGDGKGCEDSWGSDSSTALGDIEFGGPAISTLSVSRSNDPLVMVQAFEKDFPKYQPSASMSHSTTGSPVDNSRGAQGEERLCQDDQDPEGKPLLESLTKS